MSLVCRRSGSAQELNLERKLLLLATRMRPEAKPVSVFLVEDNPDDALLISERLASAPLGSFILKTAQTLSEAILSLDQGPADVVLVDLGLPDSQGLATFLGLRKQASGVPILVLTGGEDASLALAALRAGAQDVLSKNGLGAETLARAIYYALERQNIEEQLRASEERNRLLFEYAPDAYYLNDLAGKFVDGNKAAEALTGYRREEIVGKSFLESGLLSPAELARAAVSMGRSIRGEPTGPEEYRLRRKDSQEVTVEIRTYPVELHDQVLVLGMARDISARRAAEAELRESEERFRSVWEHSIDGMRLVDHAGRIIAVNEAYAHLVKVPRERLLGEIFTAVYAERVADGMLEEFCRDFAGNALPPRQALRAELWNGEEHDLEISNSYLELEHRGKLVLSVFRDVTERNRAEQQRAAFARLGQKLSTARTAQEAARIIVAIGDQLLGWDACICELYDETQDRLQHLLSLDTVKGRRVEGEPLPPRSPPEEMPKRAIEKGGFLLLKDHPAEMTPGAVPFGDTSRPSASILFVPIRNGRSVIGVLSIQSYTPYAYDERSLELLQALADHCGGALERIASQEALNAAQHRLNHLLAESPAVIYCLRLEGERVFPAWTSSYIHQLLGVSAEQARQPNWWSEHLHPEDRVSAREDLRALLQRGQIARDYRVRHANGQYRWVHVHQRVVRDAAGQPLEIVGSMVDITERKILEEQLRQAQKLEAIGQLAGGVAHDFNNLLVVMRGNAELLLMDADRYPEHTRECLKQITAAAERSANLTRQLLAFSRKQVMQSEPLSLNDLVANLTKMLKRIIGEHVDMQCHYGGDLPLVRADAGMLEQVLVNLVVNARDAMPHGGHLQLATEKVSLGEIHRATSPEARTGDFVCLKARDTGVGIHPEHLPHIFEPFFTTKELGKGTGLGLATVYGIVKQHQGWIEVSSQTGEGAEFRIFLPALPQSPTLASRDTAPPFWPGGKECILLVEDEPAVRTVTRRVLESVGYQVNEASRAREALDRWVPRAHEIDLLVTDIVMPEGVTGRELAEKLRGERPNLPVIFLSGYSAEVAGKDTDLFQRPGSWFLQKPCSSRTLLETVRHCLDSGVGQKLR